MHLRYPRLPTIDEMHATALFIREEGCATARKSDQVLRLKPHFFTSVYQSSEQSPTVTVACLSSATIAQNRGKAATVQPRQECMAYS
jgi:hypothetical protein